MLVDLLPEPRAGDALRVLLPRLIVEPAGDGPFAVHDLLRGALIRGAAAADKESLARGIWNASYWPAHHEGALWVDVKPLREALRGTGLRIDSGDDGYRLRVDDGHMLRTT